MTSHHLHDSFLTSKVPHHVFLNPGNPFTAKYIAKNGIWEPATGLQKVHALQHTAGRGLVIDDDCVDFKICQFPLIRAPIRHKLKLTILPKVSPSQPVTPAKSLMTSNDIYTLYVSG